MGAKPDVYRFDWRPTPQARLGACHMIEVPFVFDNLPNWPAAPMLAGCDSSSFTKLRDDRAELLAVVHPHRQAWRVGACDLAVAKRGASAMSRLRPRSSHRGRRSRVGIASRSESCIAVGSGGPRASPCNGLEISLISLKILHKTTYQAGSLSIRPIAASAASI